MPKTTTSNWRETNHDREIHTPNFNPQEETKAYWEQKLEDAERSVAYAKRMLAQLAIEKADTNE